MVTDIFWSVCSLATALILLAKKKILTLKSASGIELEDPTNNGDPLHADLTFGVLSLVMLLDKDLESRTTVLMMEVNSK